MKLGDGKSGYGILDSSSPLGSYFCFVNCQNS